MGVWITPEMHPAKVIHVAECEEKTDIRQSNTSKLEICLILLKIHKPVHIQSHFKYDFVAFAEQWPQVTVLG